ncbi:PKD domain-containing protein [Methanolobus mangrovi]|uniref:PKD domain-containing protein n=1 Tax=Methanolobus mangrovi TaxID=3072977 RepID=A0AA51UG64_9EURY|nr:PKD domain-containing protein [Methanolobus mangrovi]WMW22373.1 PKD domain-containing protein [Methanolobus mangrovi]
MNKRLILPVIIMLALVLLLAGLMNFQAGSAEELPDSDNSGPTMEEPVIVAQKAASTPTTMAAATSNNSSGTAPAPAPTMMGSMGAASVPKVTTATVPKESSVAVPLVVTANFTYNTECLTVSFTDMSLNTSEDTSWAWDFGDGNSSSEQNPVNIYAKTGSYEVNLLVDNGDGNSDSKMKIVSVDECTGYERPTIPVTQEVPEFPTIAIPMVAIIGMAFFFGRKQ